MSNRIHLTEDDGFRVRHGVALAVVILAFLTFLFAIFGSWYTVDQGERAVVTRNGAYLLTADPGLHFKVPFIDDVTTISMRQHTIRFACAPGADCPDDWGYSTVLQAYSRDQQPADLQVSVIFHVLPEATEAVYSQYGGSVENVARNLLYRVVPQEVKTVFGQFNAASAVQERARFNFEVNDAVMKVIGARGVVKVDSVQVENIDYSEAYEASIEQRMLAEVDVQKRQQQLAQEQIAAQIAVTQAQAKADSQLAQSKAAAEATLIQAKSDAESIKVRGQAEAEAMQARNTARLEALQAPGYTALIQAERWNGILPTTMLPGAAVPMVNLQPPTAQP